MKLSQKITIQILLLLIFLNPISFCHAQVVFTDDFSGGYNKWQDVRNTFDLWSIIFDTANVFISTPSTLAEIIPKNEFWDNNWKNYIYELDYTYLEGADKGLSFWFQDTLNWYQFHFVGNNYILSHIENGVEVWKKSGPFLLEQGKTYHMQLHAFEGSIKLFLDGQVMLDHTDPTFDNDYGKIGLKSGAGSVFPTHVQFDNIQVTLFNQNSNTLLPIKKIKQTDPLWGNEIYDSANLWADNPTISEWGCLITSITMILNYHNINLLPNGEIITPSTLNNWLKNQEDGYIKEGLVNWSAITRLVREINSKYGTTKLEYNKIPGNSITTVIEKIKLLQPTIMEVYGHFIVGNGFTQNEDDILIADPSYPYDKLSQHFENENSLISTRLLTPSNTDLSYIHIFHEKNIIVEIKNENLQTPENLITQSESTINASRTENTTELIHHEISKPESQKFYLSINSKTEVPEPYEIIIFTYDAQANMTNLTYQGVTTSTLEIDYQKQNNSTIKSNVNFDTFINDLNIYKDQELIQKNYVFYELKKLASFAKENTIRFPDNKPRYIEALVQTIEWYKESIISTAQETLNTRLSEIQ